MRRIRTKPEVYRYSSKNGRSPCGGIRKSIGKGSKSYYSTGELISLIEIEEQSVIVNEIIKLEASEWYPSNESPNKQTNGHKQTDESFYNSPPKKEVIERIIKS